MLRQPALHIPSYCLPAHGASWTRNMIAVHPRCFLPCAAPVRRPVPVHGHLQQPSVRAAPVKLVSRQAEEQPHSCCGLLPLICRDRPLAADASLATRRSDSFCCRLKCGTPLSTGPLLSFIPWSAQHLQAHCPYSNQSFAPLLGAICCVTSPLFCPPALAFSQLHLEHLPNFLLPCTRLQACTYSTPLQPQGERQGRPERWQVEARPERRAPPDEGWLTYGRGGRGGPALAAHSVGWAHRPTQTRAVSGPPQSVAPPLTWVWSR